MAIVRIPTQPTLGKTKFRIALDGSPYILRLRPNGRMNRWVLDISDGQDNPLLLGQVLQAGANILKYARFHNNLPPGVLFVVSTEDDTIDITLENLNVQTALMYSEA